PVVETDKGFHVLKLTGKRPAFTKPFAEVKPEIQRRLFHEGRMKRLEAWVEEMRKQQNVEVFEERLKEVKMNPTVVAPVATAGGGTAAPRGTGGASGSVSTGTAATTGTAAGGTGAATGSAAPPAPPKPAATPQQSGQR